MTKDKMPFFEKGLKTVDPIQKLFDPEAEYAEWVEDDIKLFGMRHKKTGKRHGLVRSVGFSIEEAFYKNGEEQGLKIRICPGDFVEVKLIHPCKSVWGHVKFNHEFEVVEGFQDRLKHNRLSKLTDLRLAELKA